jgi:hypothetical protein
MNYKITRYQPEHKTQWDDFVRTAKNATFLFYRDFMEYHSDRFEDHSLLVFKEEKLVAIIPANITGNTLHSHHGLTYGGLVLSPKTKLEQSLQIFSEVLKFLSENGIETLEIKTLPHIYPDLPSEEIKYLLFITEAQLTRRDVLSVVDLKSPFKISSGRMEGVKRGEKNLLQIQEVKLFDDFWNAILIPTLSEKHGAKPVHSLDEITLLHQRFPGNIRQFNVYHNNKIVAGTTVFESKNVAHSQYIAAAGNDKNQLGSLDFLHHHLLTEVFKDKKYFDFGISNENNGRNLNRGLSFWKEGFGAGAVTQDFYAVATKNHTKLQHVLV